MQSTKNWIQSAIRNGSEYIRILAQFLYRDFYTSLYRSRDFLINSLIVEPLIFIIAFGYLLSHIFFPTLSSEYAQAIFAGNVLLLMLKYTFDGGYRFLHDIETEKFILYKLTILPLSYVLSGYIIFHTLLTAVILMPLLPLAKLLLWYSNNAVTNWIQIMMMLCFGSLLCSAYHFCILSYIDTRSVSSLWHRYTIPLMTFAGLWIPYHIIAPHVSYARFLFLVNPFLYITEGIRQAYVGEQLFFSLWICAPAIILFSGCFIYGAYYFLKKRIDLL